ncbi:MAG: hypothetical protein CMD29_02240 [Flavobacteriales bacterium]|nr:hypothetical protein [Flavobacteriales bacterium]
MLNFKYYNKNDIDQKLWKRYNKIFQKAFNTKIKLESFNWKYLNLFTQDSIIQEINYSSKVIGYRGLWKVKNYPNEYQCIDTCILPNYQGEGIFKSSNKHLIDKIGSFYNYPNQKSKPGYLKSGWKEISKMNIYLNKLENFEFCNWDNSFLNWRFVSHPYIKYYKTKIKDGYAILRFKKKLPVHIESTVHNIDLQEIPNPMYSFKYDLKKNGIKVKNAGSILTYNFKGKLRSSYFDMI